jgi:hypothetical protein
MVNRTLFPVIVSLLFLVSIPVSAAYLEVSIPDREKTVYLGDEVSFDVDLYVLKITPGEYFYLEVSGSPQEWVQDVPSHIYVRGMSSATAEVTFLPTGEQTGQFTYTITGVPYNAPSINSSDTVILDVIRPLDIEDFTVTRQGDQLVLDLDMDSKNMREAELSFAIIDGNGDFIERFSETAEVDGPTHVERTAHLPEGMLAGDYDVKVSLMGTPVEKDYTFTILPVHDVVESVKKTSGALYDDYEITVTNEGNLVEKQYVSYKTVPNNDWVTGLITEPDDCYVNGGEKTCKYVFSDLAPGDSATLEYRLDYTPVYAAFGTVLVAIFLLVFFGMRRATSPVIIKRHVRKADGKYHVVLEIRNPFYHNLSNAIVRDWVTPLASVIHDEIMMLKPMIRRSDAGTELIWKLGDIRPKETRIITYPIKALVKGNLKMPKAYIRFNRPNGKLRRLFSRGLVIDT